ncbi:hypothetical protein [Roseateles sp. P5_E11]
MKRRIKLQDERRRSRWFPLSVEPARPGVYECEWSEDPAFQQGAEVWFNRWDGEQWHYGMASLERHQRDFWDPVPRSDRGLKRWRGLATNPINAGRTKE